MDFGADVVADGLVVAVVRGADGLVVAVVRGTDGLVVMVVRGAELSALDEAGLVVRGVDFGAGLVADGFVVVVVVVRGADGLVVAVVRGVDFGAGLVADGFVVVVVRGADGFVDVVDVVVRGVELSMLG